LQVNNLTVRSFRNIRQSQLAFDKGLNVLLGDNGQGKTNLVEAIVLCLTAKSFRQMKPEHCLPFEQTQNLNQNPFLELDLSLTSRSYICRCHIQGNKKQHSVNDKRASAAQLRQAFPVVFFSPESLTFVKGAPDLRRQLLDDLIHMVLPVQTGVIEDYKKICKTRNKILKDAQSHPELLNETLSLLDSYTDPFLNVATEFTAARLQAIKEVQPGFSNVAQELFGSKNVEFSVDYCISGDSALGWSSARIFETLKASLEQRRSAEIATGSSLVGPHKHEISFLVRGENSRFFCSQGQQRALIIAFKIAQIMYHTSLRKFAPVLILDDVMSELDGERRRYLLEYLNSIQAQTFITTTDLALSEQLQAYGPAVFHVADGEIVRVEGEDNK
jgi:DNA replication and repair protein RecF